MKVKSIIVFFVMSLFASFSFAADKIFTSNQMQWKTGAGFCEYMLNKSNFKFCVAVDNKDDKAYLEVPAFSSRKLSPGGWAALVSAEDKTVNVTVREYISKKPIFTATVGNKTYLQCDSQTCL